MAKNVSPRAQVQRVLGCQPPGYNDHLTSRVATRAFKVATDATLFYLRRLKAIALHHIKKKKNRLIKAKTKIIVYIIFYDENG